MVRKVDEQRKTKKMNTTQNHVAAKSSMYVDSQLVRPYMTLPELVALAESIATKPGILTKPEENLFSLLLQSYALGILEVEQSPNPGPVIISKPLKGEAEIVFRFAPRTNDLGRAPPVRQKSNGRPVW